MAADTLEGFKVLSPSSSIYKPPPAGKDDESAEMSSPSMIVLCTWIGAGKKHIAKYTAEYRRRYPNTTPLVCETSVYSMFFGGSITEERDTILEHIHSAANGHDGRPIVLHAFSNGGAFKALRLTESVKAKTGSTVPFTATIFDSCPGTMDRSTLSEALSLSLPRNFILNFIGLYVIWISVLLYALTQNAFGRENAAMKGRRKLNEAPLFSKNVPRLYLYSKKDELVSWEVVQEHARDARRKGYEVVGEVFEEAPHCLLLREDGKRYWGAVDRMVRRRWE
jgi:hypothetical protein